MSIMKQMSAVESLEFVIPNFRPHYKSESSQVRAFGQYWHVMLKLDRSEHVALVLKKGKSGANVVKIAGTIQFGPETFTTFKHRFSDESDGWSSGYMIAVSDVSKYLQNRDWKIKVHMQKPIAKEEQWSPKPLEKNLIYGKELLEAPVGSEHVSFSIGVERKKFHAHKWVVLHRAPALYALIQDSQSEDVEIPAITESTFKTLLHYMYVGDVPKNKDVEAIKALLKAADCFGCTPLKMHLEYEIVSNLMAAANAVDWLLFADGLTCPLIREGFMDLYESSANEVMASSAWKDVTRDILVELSTFLVGKNRFPKANDDYDNMPLYLLLKQLESFGLEMDGTRQMIVKRLKNYDAAIGAKGAKKRKREQQN